METAAGRWLLWTPRVLTIALALFLGMFALDVFGEGLGFGQAISAFVIHLIPTWLVLAVLVAAWRHEWVGGALFPVLALAYVVLTGGRQHWTSYVFLSGPLLLVGVLFWMSWAARVRAKHRVA